MVESQYLLSELCDDGIFLPSCSQRIVKGTHKTKSSLGKYQDRINTLLCVWNK